MPYSAEQSSLSRLTFGYVLQRRDLGMWMCNDEAATAAPMKKAKHLSNDIAIAARNSLSNSDFSASAMRDEVRQSGNKVLYIHRESGLFPAPLPPDAPNMDKILDRYRFLGTLMAKALLDGHLVSLPLSRPLYKALCGVPILAADLPDIDPDKARHLGHLHKVALQKRAAEELQDPQARMSALAALEDVELYSLTMEYAPSSTMHGFHAVELVPDGANVPVTNDNVHEYVKLMYSFILEEGVNAQVDAIREGISEVFPASQLMALTPTELQLMLSGEASVSWTREELLEHLEPRNGYDAHSATFQSLISVLMVSDGRSDKTVRHALKMSVPIDQLMVPLLTRPSLQDMHESERKDFLRFATGVCVLPPGGLKNLEPKLTVVRKHCDTVSFS